MKHFLLNDKNSGRDAYIWNMAGSLIMAFQSVILLMILTRVVSLTESGIFTISYANANLLLTVGKYGMRNFQVSDVRGQFTFREYQTSRWITTLIMVIAGVFWTIYSSLVNGYSMEKTLIIIWMCLFKVADCLEDVYYGEYQKRGRLDVGAKCMTVRLVATLAVFAVMAVITKNLLTSLIVSTVVALLLMVLLLKLTYPDFRQSDGRDMKNMFHLLWCCFPLFLGGFLSYYIGNAPKYAIDRALSDELQACYGFIAMPVFVIGLLNNFIFNPILFRMSTLWAEGKVKAFVKRTCLQMLIVFGITGFCLLVAYLFGIPVLSWMYHTDLSAYKRELLILLFGGGFLGLSGLLNTILTIMRNQKSLLVGYAVVAVIAFLLSDRIVGGYGMIGAALLYMILMGLLCLFFLAIFVFRVFQKRK